MKLNGKNMKNINQHNVNQKEEFKTVGSINTSKDVVMSVKDCNVFYGENQALKNINLEVGKSEVIALIGPSGCGKSTFLRCLNRLNDTIDSCRVTGEFSLEGEDISAIKEKTSALSAIMMKMGEAAYKASEQNNSTDSEEKETSSTQGEYLR